MFSQILEPAGQNLPMTILASLVPLIVLLFLLAAVRMTAWLATIIASVVTIGMAIFVWQAPARSVLRAYIYGASQGVWTIDWIVLWGLVIFNTLVLTGDFERFKNWMINQATVDIRIQTLMLAWSFGALLEGLVGFGYPWAENGLANAQDGLISAWNSWRQAKPSEQPVASAPPAAADSSPNRDPAPLRRQPSGTPRAVGSSSNASHKLSARQTASSHRSRWATSSTTRHQPAAMSASAAMPEKTPAVAVNRPASRAVPSARGGTASAPGTEEMNRAAHASAPELRAVWLWRALAKGNPEAPVELAMIYEQGSGVARSCDQARVLLRSAAAKGNEQAKQDLQQLQRGGCSSR